MIGSMNTTVQISLSALISNFNCLIMPLLLVQLLLKPREACCHFTLSYCTLLCLEQWLIRVFKTELNRYF